jgi:hypothetical protein
MPCRSTLPIHDPARQIEQVFEPNLHEDMELIAKGLPSTSKKDRSAMLST